ncbi:MAG: hypothetical protein KME31_03505 [Tolypothrix carrinoi HA7290-LM1]|jgi:hypothetical protein|nr:hypothetical protein [Tolypothrix carrinoi HA7290-LM1]
MAKKPEKNFHQPEDIRVTATTKIWGLTVGILAICVPLSVVTKSGAIIPLAAIGGAGVGTVAVWRSGDKKYQNKLLSPQQVELLEQRIADLETIVSGEEFDLRMKIKRLQAKESDRQEEN